MDALPISTREKLEDEYMSLSSRLERMRVFIEGHADAMKSDPDFGLFVVQANALASYVAILRLRLQFDYEKRTAGGSDAGDGARCPDGLGA